MFVCFLSALFYLVKLRAFVADGGERRTEQVHVQVLVNDLKVNISTSTWCEWLELEGIHM